MSAKRIEMHRLQELVRLHRMGECVRSVARLLKMGPNVERRYRKALEEEGLLEGDPQELPELWVLKEAVMRRLPPKLPPPVVSSVEGYGEEIKEMLEKEASPTAIHDCLRLTHEDFAGSLSAVKRYCLRKKKEKGINPEDVVIPVESGPGEEAQVDFGYVGKLYDPYTGCKRKAWVFVMTLSYSRHMYADLVFDQSNGTWLRLHVKGFEWFGGSVKTLVPDNLKAAVVRAAFGSDGATSLNRSYRELARHYGCKVDPAPPRSPEKKGKVESAVKYVKRNFFRPRDFADVEEARKDLARWVMEIAGKRRHGVTGRHPVEFFERHEKPALNPLPAVPFEIVVWKRATVHRDSHIEFGKRLYSVPWTLIGKEVWVRATESSLSVYANDEIVAVHDRRGKGWRSTQDAHLPELRSDYRHRSRRYWEERADRIGKPVGDYIREVFDSDDVLSRLRTVQGMVTHLESFPAHRACAACLRASRYGNHTLRGLKNILRLGLDIESVGDDEPLSRHIEKGFRFARCASEFAR